ncbi:putative RNA polymerase II subunit B1 CTD phosphatase RPAP2 homolog [Zingiber officinale]|uniref:RNA polymerase II subunit B1 CTD phosphatase RPAP2 homolog n=1 Tax=Zingiber officinale TaxID=94328 RepID=A0A8J5LC57_ZINOF|nr:putative RNA polymerase II subunit B1 CTD phosphatase RPAP2 homolog [Zingiber officinale]KAG6512864.1 hypothetical protein ZIOFF_030998 [Zingiber officinale]
MATPPTPATVAGVVHQIQKALLDGAACSEGHLFEAAALISRSDYEDVVVELSIEGICGYPLCRKPLPSDRQTKGRYRISMREHKVFDLQETYKYCSEACVVSSRAFASTLSKERSYDVSSSKIEQILNMFLLQADLGKDKDLEMINLTIREKGDAGKGEVSLDEWLGPSNAIEGFVPRYDQNHGGLRSDRKPSKILSTCSTNDPPHEVDFRSDIILKNEDNGLAFSAHGTIDASEAIAKKLEELVLAERKIKTIKKTAKSIARNTMNKDSAGNENSRMINTIAGEPSSVAQNFTETSTLFGDQDSKIISAVKGLCCELNNDIHVEKMAGSNGSKHEHKKEASTLKSSLRTSRPKNTTRSVKWADEINSSAQKEIRHSLHSSKAPQKQQVEDDSFVRLMSAEACAAALNEASEAVAAGVSEAGDAASEAGIVVLCQSQFASGEVEEDEDTFNFDRGHVKWTKKTFCLDTDMLEVEDSWHEIPPEGFSLELSSFATMWMALFGWITCSSLAYIYGCDESSREDFLEVNGQEYPYKIVKRDGLSAEIRRTIDGCVCRALPALVRELGIRIPISTLEYTLGRYLDTMSYLEALPAFKLRQWQAIVLLFLDAFSVHRLPSLTQHLANVDVLLHKVLNAAQISLEQYQLMADHIMPLGRSHIASQ